MITKEINDLFTSLVRARLFLPNADGAKAFAHLLIQITMQGQPKPYGHKVVKRKRKKGALNFAKVHCAILTKLRTAYAVLKGTSIMKRARDVI